MTDPVFRDDISTYTGVGRPLVIAEFDGNTLLFHERLNVLEAETGKKVDFVEYTGTALIVHYTDTTTDGPFPLPVGRLRPAGAWANDTPYVYGDLVTVPNQGVFLVLVDHTTPASPAVFDPEATDESSDLNPLYYQMMTGSDIPYDIAFAIVGVLPEVPTAGTLIGQFVVPRAITIAGDFTGSFAYMETPAFLADVQLSIEYNGTEVGTIMFLTAANVGTFEVASDAADLSLVAGDRLALRLIVGDTAASDMSVTIVGLRADI